MKKYIIFIFLLFMSTNFSNANDYISKYDESSIFICEGKGKNSEYTITISYDKNKNRVLASLDNKGDNPKRLATINDAKIKIKSNILSKNEEFNAIVTQQNSKESSLIATYFENSFGSCPTGTIVIKSWLENAPFTLFRTWSAYEDTIINGTCEGF